MARLPIPGDDVGTWGGILNDFLSVELNSDGTLKSNGSLSTYAPLSNPTFTGTVTVPNPTSATDAVTKHYVDTQIAAGAPDADSSTKGIIQLSGDLGGTASSPTVPGLANKVNTSTTINGQSLSGNITIDADDIDDTSTTHKFVTATDISKLATIESGAEVNTVHSVNSQTGDVTLDKSHIGLGNADNTSDADKPISIATISALSNKADISSLSAVATTGDYDDLINKPIFPTDLGSFTGTSDDITEGIANLYLTAAERSKISGIEAGADVTDAANVNAAGATMNSDTNVSGNAWVLDEDDFVSNSNTKVPTQQSVKVYVDDLLATGSPDATASTKGKVRLAGDLGGTADVPTVPALLNRVLKTGDTMTGKLTVPSIQITGGSPVTDYVLMTDNVGNGTWKPVPSAPVNSVNTKQGNVVIDKADIGLGNADNTSDANKPISSATQTALNAKESTANKGQPNGYASLDGGGTIPISQLPNQSGSYIPIATKGVAGGVAELDSSTRLPAAQLPSAIPYSALPVGTSGSTVARGNDSRITNAIQSSALDTDNTLAANSDARIATQKATKEYVDNQIASGTAPDATAGSKGILQLTEDLGGTADAPTVRAAAGLKSSTTTVTTSGASAPSSGQFLRASNGSTASWQAMPRTFGWYFNDDISTGDGQGPIYRLDANATVIAFDVNAKQPPANVAQFDVQTTTNPASGWTSIFSALPTITSGQYIGSNGTLNTTNLNAGVYIRFCVVDPGGDGSGDNVAAGVTTQLRLQTR